MAQAATVAAWSVSGGGPGSSAAGVAVGAGEPPDRWLAPRWAPEWAAPFRPPRGGGAGAKTGGGPGGAGEPPDRWLAPGWRRNWPASSGAACDGTPGQECGPGRPALRGHVSTGYRRAWRASIDPVRASTRDCGCYGGSAFVQVPAPCNRPCRLWHQDAADRNHRARLSVVRMPGAVAVRRK